MVSPLSTSKPVHAPKLLAGVLERLSGKTQLVLTGLCLLFLVASFIPNGEHLAYLSVAAGSYFALKSAIEAIRQKELDINLLMVLAAAGAIVVGRVRDASALLFLFSLSSTLEAYTMAKTKAAIEKLIQLRPTTAILLRDGVETRIPIEELQVGDSIRIPSFEKIPLDGEVVDGASSIDESALTGESIPVSKSTGSRVVSGTQNLEGTLAICVTQTVGNSTLDRIIAMVQEAQENKASGEKLSHWFGQRYTIFVLAAFTISWVVRSIAGQDPGQAFYSALILLVGLSPCALVISTPASTLSALAKAARCGILVRGGEFIEKVADIDIIALDKTGTVTEGKPQLLSYAILSGAGKLQTWDKGDDLNEQLSSVLGAVASVENLSSHPLARSLVVEAQSQGLTVSTPGDAITCPGLGITATIEGSLWLVGNDRLLEQAGISISTHLLAEEEKWKLQGWTTVFAHGPEVDAVFAFGDSVRAESEAAIRSLYRLGVKHIVMLTGDKRETAEAIARQVGIREVQAGLMPEDKTKFIEKLSKDGNVMMIGDGVNDAPSLALASVGVAMGGLGSDVALEAADVVLMKDNLMRLPELIRLGRRTRKVIRVNLAFAVGMIAALAIGSFVTNLPLPLAVLGHEGSTVLVILNGLRLLR